MDRGTQLARIDTPRWVGIACAAACLLLGSTAWSQKPKPRVISLGSVSVTGARTSSSRPLRPVLPSLGVCYQRALAGRATTRGLLQHVLRIGPSGEVTTVTSRASRTLPSGLLQCARRASLAARFPPLNGGSALLIQQFLLWPAASSSSLWGLASAPGGGSSLPYEPDWSAFSITRPKNAAGSPRAIGRPRIILAVNGDSAGDLMRALRERVGKCAGRGLSHDVKLKLLVLPDGSVRDLALSVTPAAPSFSACLKERIGSGFQNHAATRAWKTSAHLLVRGEEVSLVR